MKKHISLFKLSFCLPFLLVAACDMTTPSQVKTGQIRIAEKVKTETLASDRIDVVAIDRLARDFRENGRGDAAGIISYQGPSAANEAAARKQATLYARVFAAAGVPLKTSIVSVPDQASSGRAVISYTALTALPPADCTRMTGYQGADSLQEVKGYEMGCEVKSSVSRMIVKSEDLLGGSSEAGTDSRRAGTTVEQYKNGIKNEKLNSMTASTVGGGG